MKTTPPWHYKNTNWSKLVLQEHYVKLLYYQKLALDSVIFLLTELDECSSHVFKLV